MNTTIVSGHREKLIGHLRLALNRLEAGEDHYRLSTVSTNGGATDLVFEVDPVMDADPDRYSHLMVQEIDGLRIAGRPTEWIAGESLR
jgi:hypothetical protein